MAFFAGYKYKEHYLNDAEKTQALLLKIKKAPYTALTYTQKVLLAKYSLHKALPDIIKRAKQGETHEMWLLYRASKQGKLCFKYLHHHQCHPKVQNGLINTSISVNSQSWPTDAWLEVLVQKNYWPAMVEKGQLLLQENNAESNKRATKLLEKIEYGMGGNFNIACPILADIFKNGINGVPADSEKHAYYAELVS